MQQFLIKFIVIFTITVNVYAQEKEKKVGYVLIPRALISAEKKYSEKDIEAMYKSFYNSRQGQDVLGAVGVTGDHQYASYQGFSNNAQDTKQARCYRCALGQEVGVSKKSWCEQSYGFWDISKVKAKKKCH